MKDIETRAFAVLRSHPDYVAPESLVRHLRELLDSGRYRLLDA